MSELSPEIKRLLRKFKESQQREATSEDLRKVLEPLIPKVIEEESVFIRKARLVLEPPSEEEKPVQKQAIKPKEKKSTLSPLQRAFVWFTTKIEEVRQQVEGLKERLTKGHGSQVNADKVDDLHAQEIAQRALDIMQAGKGGGIYAGFDKYTDAEAISAVEGEATLDLTGVIPDSAYPNALLLSGLRPMTGDIDLDAYGTGSGVNVVKWGSGVDVPFIFSPAIGDFRFLRGNPRAKGSASWANIHANILNMYTGFRGMTGRAIYVRADDRIYFQTYKSAAPAGWVTGIDLHNETVRMPNLPVADPEDGTSTIWSNGGVLTVGT